MTVFMRGVLVGLSIACAIVLIVRVVVRREMRKRHARVADAWAARLGLQRLPGETTEALMSRLATRAGWPPTVTHAHNNAWKVITK